MPMIVTLLYLETDTTSAIGWFWYKLHETKSAKMSFHNIRQHSGTALGKLAKTRCWIVDRKRQSIIYMKVEKSLHWQIGSHSINKIINELISRISVFILSIDMDVVLKGKRIGKSITYARALRLV